jgi:deoxyribonuclease V
LASSKFAAGGKCFIIFDVKINALHNWDLSLSQARVMQIKLARQVVASGKILKPHLVAGVDVCSHRSRTTGTAAVVVLSYPDLKMVEVEREEAELPIPYIAGLLSFRECPLILAACARLQHTPDLFLVDGQGIAHPRRLGLAAHLGLFLDVPSIGCAKSILCGSHEPLNDEVGSYAVLIDREEVIGAALRTKYRTKPMYVSIGHKIDLASALYWVRKCCCGYRLPQPTRLAHLAAGGNQVS